MESGKQRSESVKHWDQGKRRICSWLGVYFRSSSQFQSLFPAALQWTEVSCPKRRRSTHKPKLEWRFEPSRAIWTGAKYAVTDKVDAIGAYYHYDQNNF